MTDTTARERATLGDARRLAYTVGRVLLIVGIVFCGTGVLIGLVESPDSLFDFSAMGVRIGGEFVGWGGVLVAVGRADELYHWFQTVGRNVPGLRAVEFEGGESDD